MNKLQAIKCYLLIYINKDAAAEIERQSYENRGN